MQGDIQDNMLRVMLAEYDWLGDDQKRYNDFHRKDAKIFVGVIAALIALSASRQSLVPSSIISLLIPSLVFLFFMMQIVNLHTVVFEAKRRASLERMFNDFFSAKVMAWESEIALRYIRPFTSPSYFGSVSVFFLLLLVFGIFAVHAHATSGWWVTALHSFELLAMVFTVIQWCRYERKSLEPTDAQAAQQEGERVTSTGPFV